MRVYDAPPAIRPPACCLAQLGKGGESPRCIPCCRAVLATGNHAGFRTIRRCVVSAVTDAPAAPPAVRKRSGSQKRRRRHAVNVTYDDDEFLQVQEKANAAGLSLASFLRAGSLGTPGPRARRSPPLNAEALARATGAVNKVGSNLNQIARVLNAARAVAATEILAAAAEAQAAMASIREAVGRTARP